VTVRGNKVTDQLPPDGSDIPIPAQGGGMAVAKPSGGPGFLVSVVDSTFEDNVADGSNLSGGAIAVNAGELRVSNSTFSGNAARGCAGLACVFVPTPGKGGAIYAAGNLEIEASTFADNVVSGDGAGTGGADVAVLGFPGFSGTIFSGAGPGTACLDLTPGESAPVTEAVVDPDGSCSDGGADDVPGTAVLGPLQDNGGPTDTRRLVAGSPGIDGWANASCVAQDVPADQRGAPRPDTAGAPCDIGAVERQADTDGDGRENLFDNCPDVANADQRGARRSANGAGPWSAPTWNPRPPRVRSHAFDPQTSSLRAHSNRRDLRRRSGGLEVLRHVARDVPRSAKAGRRALQERQ
jgi:hypothetical protein